MNPPASPGGTCPIKNAAGPRIGWQPHIARWFRGIGLGPRWLHLFQNESARSVA